MSFASQASIRFLRPALSGLLLLLGGLLLSAGFVAAEPLRDSRGETVQLSAPPARIVSLAPSLTETLCRFGQRDRLVGRTRFCRWPATVESVPPVGGVADPVVEEILRRAPDLVVATRLTPADVIHQLEQLGIPVFVFAHEGLDGLSRDLHTLARLIGPEPESDAFLAAWEDRLHDLRARLAAIPAEDKPRTLLLYGVDGLYSGGTGSFAGELIAVAGGENLADRTGRAWPQLSREHVLAWNPEVLVVAISGSETEVAATRATLAQWQRDPAWRHVAAITTDQIVIIDESRLSIPGPRALEALAIVAHALHPELVAAP